ncbi:MAG TPA: TraR/DksA family transcriptional regulator [Bryobacteraceae bacterium]|nr:TraR/DksA family transcriptional regulator [Bryobacteraceae bacterium]
MKSDLRLARQILEARLKDATSGKELGDSIRIHQVADPIDMTQEASERDVAVQILDRESALVRQLRSALDRIRDGSYGICLQCEEEIAPKRLKAMAWAELCIHCQEKADSLGRQRGYMPSSEEWTEAA